jgi:hypothetical protein
MKRVYCLRKLLIISLLFLVSCTSGSFKKNDCYIYGKVTIKGILEKRPYSNKNSSYWILVTEPFCTKIKPNEELFEAYQSQTEIHLSMTDFDKYKNLLGKNVYVFGDLYSAHTGHHMRNILILVNKIVGVE